MKLLKNEAIIEYFQSVEKNLEENSRNPNKIHERWEILEEAGLYGVNRGIYCNKEWTSSLMYNIRECCKRGE